MPDKYIVVFKEGVAPEKVKEYIQEVGQNGGKVTNEYDSAILNGFAAEIPENYLGHLKSLQGDAIAYIEPDGVVTTQQ